MTVRTTRRAVAAGAAVLAVLAADTASAATGTIKAPPGEQVVVQSTPSVSGKNLRLLSTGTKVRIVCQTYGQTMTGPFGTSNVWNRLAKGGYVTDTKTHTGSDGLVAPLCASRGGNGNGAGGRGRDAAQTTMRDDYGNQPANPFNFVTRNCTAFVAIRLNRGGVPIHNHWRAYWGNASRWDGVARSLGIRVDGTPRVGSVLQSDRNGAGHVAVVSRVLSPDRIVVEEYNYATPLGYGQRTISPRGYEFIHFKR